ncbi:18831_t:CDS:1, partial [Racocetra persica]
QPKNVIPDLNVIPIKPPSPVCETETSEHQRVLVSVENSKPELIVNKPLVKPSVNLKKEVDEHAEPKIVNQLELKLASNVESVNANKNNQN